MIRWRTKHSLSYNQLADISDVSPGLIEMLENGDVTHPNIAKRVAKAYGLTEMESYELMPEIHRPNSPLYDPKRYVEEDPDDRFSIHKERKYA